MSAKRAKRCNDIASSDNGINNDHTVDDTKEITKNSATNVCDFKSVFSIHIIVDKIMSYLTYRDVYNLALSCRALKELTRIEFERRRNGWSPMYLLYRLKYVTSEASVHHPKGDARATVHFGIQRAQQKLSEAIDQLHFRPKIAFLMAGNVKSREHQLWSRWFKRRLPHECTVLNVLSKTAICGSIDRHVYEAHHNKFDGNCGLAYLLFGTQRGNRSTHVFKSLKELVRLTDADARRNEPVKCILYFTRSQSCAPLSKILSVCKERNNNCSVAFGGLVIDSLVSLDDDDAYKPKLQCAGLVFSGADSELKAASAIIEDMTDEQIRNSMIRFRDSIPFDIADPTMETICFLLSCIEHSPHPNYSSEYTASESDIFHTIFPSNVRTFGFSGHGEFGQVSGLLEEQKKIDYQYSCVIVVVQFPIR